MISLLKLPEPKPKPIPRKISKLAQRYLGGADKLDIKAIDWDLKGHSEIGDLERKEAAKCRAKAEKLIKEASGH